jgi:hypothetical protein
VLLIYMPQDGERQEFPFKPNRLLSVEAEAIEDVGGESWSSHAEWWSKLGAGNFKARRALLWVMLRRANPRLRFAEVVIYVDELLLDYDEDERARIRERIESSDMDANEKAANLRLLDDGESTELPAEDGEVPEGKSPTSDESSDSA